MPLTKITRYPASMTGAKLRKQLGFLEPRRRKTRRRSFKISKRLLDIPKDRRLDYLREMDAKAGPITLGLTSDRRRNFDAFKNKQLPLGGAFCYVCDGRREVVRHHVLPLAAGGSNKRNNIVPLCRECHGKVHPWLA